jgi:hypothetical protein
MLFHKNRAGMYIIDINSPTLKILDQYLPKMASLGLAPPLKACNSACMDQSIKTDVKMPSFGEVSLQTLHVQTLSYS